MINILVTGTRGGEDTSEINKALSGWELQILEESKHRGKSACRLYILAWLEKGVHNYQLSPLGLCAVPWTLWFSLFSFFYFILRSLRYPVHWPLVANTPPQYT